MLPVSKEGAASGEWLPELHAKMQVVPNTINGALPGPDPERRLLRSELGISEAELVVLRRPAGAGQGSRRAARGGRTVAQVQHPVRFLLADGPLRAGLEAQAVRFRPPGRCG